MAWGSVSRAQPRGGARTAQLDPPHPTPATAAPARSEATRKAWFGALFGKKRAEKAPVDLGPYLAPLMKHQKLQIRQSLRQEIAQDLAVMQLRNLYSAYDEHGNLVYGVHEFHGGAKELAERGYLGMRRPFEVHVHLTPEKKGDVPALKLKREFNVLHPLRALYFSRMTVEDANGKVVGIIKRRFPWFCGRYHICDEKGERLATMRASPVRWWTFKYRSRKGDGRPLGQVRRRIVDKWTPWQIIKGLLRWRLTNADSYDVEFGSVRNPQLRALMFSAAILADFDMFDNRVRTTLAGAGEEA